jgi:transposase
MVDALVWILRTGAPWRDLPKHFGPWQSAYTRFRRWNKQGVWPRVLEVLAAQHDSESYLIDATIVRAHQDASGAAPKKATNPSAALEEDRAQRFTFSWTPSDTPFASD